MSMRNGGKKLTRGPVRHARRQPQRFTARKKSRAGPQQSRGALLKDVAWTTVRRGRDTRCVTRATSGVYVSSYLRSEVNEGHQSTESEQKKEEIEKIGGEKGKPASKKGGIRTVHAKNRTARMVGSRKTSSNMPQKKGDDWEGLGQVPTIGGGEVNEKRGREDSVKSKRRGYRKRVRDKPVPRPAVACRRYSGKKGQRGTRQPDARSAPKKATESPDRKDAYGSEKKTQRPGRVL